MALAFELDIDVALPFDLKEQMASMNTIGYSLLPLGKGADGKSPTVEFDGRSRFPLAFVAERMAQTGSTMYGVRCDGLVVVDIDNRKPVTLQYAERRFGVTPYTVETQDGAHWYFKASEDTPADSCIRIGQIQIDVKHGANSFVVGPGSARHDTGVVYTMDGEPLTPIRDLPVFMDRGVRKFRTVRQSSQVATNESNPAVVQADDSGVPVGQRFEHLKVKAREFVRNVGSQQELFDALKAYAIVALEDGTTFPDAKIQHIAKWTWGKRLSGDLWGGSNSPVQILPHELDKLDQYKNGNDALRLLIELRRCHAPQPGKRFKIAGKAMAGKSAIGDWKKTRFYDSKDTLCRSGLVQVAKKANRIGQAHEYQLVSLPLPYKQ